MYRDQPSVCVRTLDSKFQLPQLGFPRTPGQLSVVPMQAFAHCTPEQPTVALGCEQSRQPVPQCKGSVDATQVAPQRFVPRLHPVMHAPVVQEAIPLGKLQGTPHPPQLLFVEVGVSQPSVSLATAAQLPKPGLQPDVPTGTKQPPEALHVAAPALTLDRRVQLCPHEPQFVGVFKSWQTPPQQL